VAAGLEVARAVYKQLESFKKTQRSEYNPKKLHRDLPAYVAAASGFSIDHGDVDDFTEGILGWWKSHASEVGAWSDAALIAFAMVPNSAEAERVFFAQKPLREQPGHCPRRLHSRIDGAPLQQHQAR
jgi:hypothetical protein